MKKTSILCVHQGADAYGSDRSFVQAVAALQTQNDYSIDILIPEAGPILDLFAEQGLPRPTVRSLWILRRADFLSAMTVGLPKRVVAVKHARQDIDQVDVLYVNTTVVASFLLASWSARRSPIVHVREIPTGIAMRVLRRLLVLTKARVIFNSHATSAAFALPSDQLQCVVYNGFSRPAPFEKAALDDDRPLNVLCLGRLNAWKGQDTLIAACAELPDEVRAQLSVRLVGGVYRGQERFRQKLAQQIRAHGLEGTIELVDFTPVPSSEYINADVVVVPSTKPEPFGRVAIEGMAFACAILAAKHGGLAEIVVEGQTGHTFPPGDVSALRDLLVACSNDRRRVAEMGRRGMSRFETMFSQEMCDESFLRAFRELTDT